MLPLGISLTKRATADKGLIGFGHVIDFFKNLFKKKSDLATHSEHTALKGKQIYTNVLDVNSSEYKDLLEKDSRKLTDIVQNYKQYDYSPEFRNSAIAILNSRGIGIEELRLKGKLKNENYQKGEDLLKMFNRNSKIAFILYSISFILMTFL